MIELANRKWTLLSEYKNAKLAVTLRCEHGHIFSMRPDNILYSPRCNRCPHCSKSNSFSVYETTYFYIVRYIVGTRTVIKYGITNDYNKRFRDYSKRKMEILSIKYFTDGFYAKQIENKIKATFKSATTKKEFGDGFTETVEDTQANIDSIMSLVW